MHQGTIIIYENYRFNDGSIKDKLFIILNNSLDAHYLFTLKTTSQVKKQRLRINTTLDSGCNEIHKMYYLIKQKHENMFDRDTIIHLDKVYKFRSHEIIHKKFKDECRIIGKLSNNILSDVLKCFKNYQDDIEIEVFKSIFGND